MTRQDPDDGEAALARARCTPCGPGTVALDPAAAARAAAGLPGWRLSQDAATLSRRFEVKGFAKAVELANLAAWLGNHQGHHPDVAFGWGHCTVSFTTHAAGGLTRNDLICAARLNALLD